MDGRAAVAAPLLTNRAAARAVRAHTTTRARVAAAAAVRGVGARVDAGRTARRLTRAAAALTGGARATRRAARTARAAVLTVGHRIDAAPSAGEQPRRAAVRALSERADRAARAGVAAGSTVAPVGFEVRACGAAAGQTGLAHAAAGAAALAGAAWLPASSAVRRIIGQGDTAPGARRLTRRAARPTPAARTAGAPATAGIGRVRAGRGTAGDQSGKREQQRGSTHELGIFPYRGTARRRKPPREARSLIRRFLERLPCNIPVARTHAPALVASRLRTAHRALESSPALALDP